MTFSAASLASDPARCTNYTSVEAKRKSLMNRNKRAEHSNWIASSAFALLAIAALFAVSCDSGVTTPAPVAPTPPVSTITPPLPWVYSQIFSSASPFHTAVAALKANGAVVLPQKGPAPLHHS